ncbi:unnamed protein product [marine sediment metagenome]|uniref:Uncharacterized protein n=1 Tax=marine sediment metagenome TaxID=412755 RepID=X1PUI1_9ZZZZ
MDLTNITTKNRNQGDLLSNCHHTCKRLIDQKYPGAKIRKVINIHDPWGDKPGFFVEHKIGNYHVHYVLEKDEEIIDPFLLEEGLISKKDYLQKYYKNSQELRIV